jgi:DNA-binding response OmpR family regulator
MSKKVLYIVDDEPNLCELVAEIFRDEGYEVFEFIDPVLAFANAEKRIQNGEALDLILTDVNMPGLTGIQMAKNLRKIGFNKSVVLLSGESGDEFEQLKTISEITGVEQKPYKTDKLVVNINEYLKKSSYE